MLGGGGIARRCSCVLVLMLGNWHEVAVLASGVELLVLELRVCLLVEQVCIMTPNLSVRSRFGMGRDEVVWGLGVAGLQGETHSCYWEQMRGEGAVQMFNCLWPCY